MSFKGFSISSFGGHFVQQNYLSNDGRWSPKEHFCEIIMISGHWPTRRCCLKVFLFLALVAILFSRAKVLAILVEDPSPKEHFCEIILISGHKCRRRCRLKVFSILSSGGHFA